MSQILLSDANKRRIEHLCDEGDSAELISAIEKGVFVVLVGTGEEEKEWFLHQFLKRLGVDHKYYPRCCLVQFEPSNPDQEDQEPYRGII